MATTSAATTARSRARAPHRASSPAKARHLIVVQVEMPHLAKYGKPTTLTLTYGCNFDIAEGQTVLCPPTRLHPKWTKGRVVAIDDAIAPSGYKGPIKYVSKLGKR